MNRPIGDVALGGLLLALLTSSPTHAAELRQLDKRSKAVLLAADAPPSALQAARALERAKSAALGGDASFAKQLTGLAHRWLVAAERETEVLRLSARVVALRERLVEIEEQRRQMQEAGARQRETASRLTERLKLLRTESTGATGQGAP